MMVSRMGVRNRGSGDSHSIMFLTEIEAIGKALHIENNNPSRSLISSTSGRSKPQAKTQLPDPKLNPRFGCGGEETSHDKRSIWNWRSLKAFSRSKKLKCSFYVHVHTVEGLPSGFNGTSFSVHWKRHDGKLSTSPAKVSQGVAEFEERLVHICSVHVSRSGPHHSAKYEPKHCLLYATMVASPELDLGKHRVDLTRLLPLTFEELEGEKSSGKWGTSYKLSGEAAGAVMNISFGYSLIGDKVSVPNQSVPVLLNNSRHGDDTMRMSHGESLPNVKDLHVVMPNPKSELAGSLITLYQKLDEDEPEPDTFTDPVEPVKPNTQPLMESSTGNGCKENIEFSVIERGIELPENSEETAAEETKSCTLGGQLVVHDDKELLMKDLESALQNVRNLEVELDSLDSLEDEDDNLVVESDNVSNSNRNSISFNDVTESEFLKMLGIENSPVRSSSGIDTESPREHTLTKLEKDTPASTSSPFAVETEILAESFGFQSTIQEAKVEQQITVQEGNSKRRARMLEDLETEALMREWGLTEKAFQYSPPKSSDRFGSSYGLSAEEALTLPPLGKAMSPFLQTKDGGFVRTMNPSLFRGTKSGGSLIMQVSRPVIVPAEMGSGIVEILRGLASVGMEKLSMQASELMPLEDITGKTMQQLALEAGAALEGHERECLPEYESGQCTSHGQKRGKERSSLEISEMGMEYVSLKDLAPLAMEKIEALCMEGLRIQSNMSDDEAPSTSSINSKPARVSAQHGKGRAVGQKLLDIKDNADGLISLSVTIDEWMKLDAGEIGEEEEISERTSKILAAHHAKGGKSKSGLMGNNITVASMVQLRDPLRNYQPVGAPMLSLIQVERVFVVESGHEPDSRTNTETKETKEVEEEAIARFKITQVHVAGLKTEPGKKKKLWGSSNQQQSGSRWLIANGMGKSNKSPFLKSKVVSKSTKVQPGESLWSISSRVLGTGAKWKELAAINPHIRNPNVIFPDETIRLS